MQHQNTGRQHRTIFVLFAVATSLATGCSADSPSDGADANRTTMTHDASLDGAGGQGRGGAGQGGAGAQAGVGGSGGIRPPLPPTPDADPPDDSCVTPCFYPGGQYCGRVGYRCGVGYVDCPPCEKEGFTCGGSGLPGVCGAARDSGACDPVECNQRGGQYCGMIGGGCGDILNCGSCPTPLRCGGGGTQGACGIMIGGCMPILCQNEFSTYCGAIGDGCGKGLDCGLCPAGQRCGERFDHVCNAPCPLCPQIVRCEDGGTTTVSGTAVTAARMNPDPLSGAIVFIPNAEPGSKLPPLVDGPACSPCTPLENERVLASAVTGPDGRFTLRDVPVGTGIPIVVQLGAWRMQTTIDVAPCIDNILPSGAVRLPRNQREGDIPLTAISTGQHDTVECLLRKMGVDDAEFTNPWGAGRIHLYHSNGAIIDASTPDESVLKGLSAGGGRWSSYNQVLLACEGAEIAETPETVGNFADYLHSGGRVLATHFSYVWLFPTGPFANVGAWTPGKMAPAGPLATDVVTSSARGVDFAAWLAHTGALSRPTPPQMRITTPHANLGALTTGAGADLWLSSFSPPTSQAVGVGMPIHADPEDRCGQVVFSDFHTDRAPSASNTFPAECGPSLTLSADEKALEYMVLYLGACTGPQVTKVLPPPPAPPRPPPVVPPSLPPPPPPD
jgi:hypothetical protein